MNRNAKLRIAVIGAGAFGGWTALCLLRRGAHVTLLDAWGPGNARASSGGETRIIRASYGPDAVYSRLAMRALQLWREHEQCWRLQLFHRIGCLRMMPAGDVYEDASASALRQASVPFELLDNVELSRRFPQINFDGVHCALLESEAGYLKARRACEAVLDAFLREGGEYRLDAVAPGRISLGRMEAIHLSHGDTIAADHYIFACGPWLGRLFPGVLGDHIQPTRQEVFFFGTPPGDPRLTDDALPAFIDRSGPHFYGIPGNQWRGLKLADDDRGPEFDPTTGDRTPTAQGIAAARRYLEHRFPGMRGAPLLECRVCQYENSRDGHFIVDRHPEAANAWLAGGGSGHGFKFGPAMGEMMTGLILDGKLPDPVFSLARFSA